MLYAENYTTYQFVRKNGHLYYAFPLGTSLFALPAVWLANLRGDDMVLVSDNQAWQKTLAAGTVALCFALIYLISTLFVDYTLSFFMTFLYVFGSPITSTIGTALWSVGLETVFILGSIYPLARRMRDPEKPVYGGLVGFLMFSAFLCRPTAAIFAVLGLVALFIIHRLAFVSALAVIITGTVFFVLFSLGEFGQLLPDYYMGGVSFSRPSSPFLETLYGIILSPSKGILILCPYLALIVMGVIYFFRRLLYQRLFLFVLAWLALHLAVHVSTSDWWGGYSFGGRYFANVVPAFLVLTLLVIEQWRAKPFPVPRVVIWGFIVSLGAAAIFIHSYQGLYNLYTRVWNTEPDINKNIQYLFDWRYPQFLASPQLIAARYRDYQSKIIRLTGWRNLLRPKAKTPSLRTGMLLNLRLQAVFSGR